MKKITPRTIIYSGALLISVGIGIGAGSLITMFSSICILLGLCAIIDGIMQAINCC
ncbi:MAG: hypothetical protein WC119_00335 [Synergistaceae bacterium]